MSYDRLPAYWKRNEACPLPCDLGIEIISPGQTLKEFETKAEDYFAAGVSRVWVVDPEAMTIRIFSPDGLVLLYSEDMLIMDAVLPGLKLTTKQVFEEAELMKENYVTQILNKMEMRDRIQAALWAQQNLL